MQTFFGGDYLDSINKRQKWTGEQRNISVGDVVLLCDENKERNNWKLARVVECFTSNDGLVRSVKIQLASNELDRGLSLWVDRSTIPSDHIESYTLRACWSAQNALNKDIELCRVTVQCSLIVSQLPD